MNNLVMKKQKTETETLKNKSNMMQCKRIINSIIFTFTFVINTVK